MQRSIQSAKQFRALYESVEAHTEQLRHLLDSRNSSEEIRLEVERLNRLLSSFTYTNELLQRLLDCADGRLRRERTREALKVLRLRGIIEGREPLTEMRDLSNRTICRTLALLTQARGVYP